jgi:hypothetical protein
MLFPEVRPAPPPAPHFGNALGSRTVRNKLSVLSNAKSVINEAFTVLLPRRAHRQLGRRFQQDPDNVQDCNGRFRNRITSSDGIYVSNISQSSPRTQRSADSFPFSIPHSKSSHGPSFSIPNLFSTFDAAFNAPSHMSRCIGRR